MPIEFPFFRTDLSGDVKELKVLPTSCLLDKNRSVTIIYVASLLALAALKASSSLVSWLLQLSTDPAQS